MSEQWGKFNVKRRSQWDWNIKKRGRKSFTGRWIRLCVVTQYCRDLTWCWSCTWGRRCFYRSWFQIIGMSYSLSRGVDVLIDEFLDPHFRTLTTEEVEYKLDDGFGYNNVIVIIQGYVGIKKQIISQRFYWFCAITNIWTRGINCGILQIISIFITLQWRLFPGYQIQFLESIFHSVEFFSKIYSRDLAAKCKRCNLWWTRKRVLWMFL